MWELLKQVYLPPVPLLPTPWEACQNPYSEAHFQKNQEKTGHLSLNKALHMMWMLILGKNHCHKEILTHCKEIFL